MLSRISAVSLLSRLLGLPGLSGTRIHPWVADTTLALELGHNPQEQDQGVHPVHISSIHRSVRSRSSEVGPTFRLRSSGASQNFENFAFLHLSLCSTFSSISQQILPRLQRNLEGTTSRHLQCSFNGPIEACRLT